MSDMINIQVDEKALREQVRAILDGEMALLSWRLEEASRVVHPQSFASRREEDYQYGFKAGQQTVPTIPEVK